MSFIEKVYDFFVLRNFYEFKINPEITKQIIEKLGFDKGDDYISRSYKQFYGYRKIQGNLKIFLLNLMSFFMLPVSIVLFFISSIFLKKNNNRSNLAISFALTEGIIPKSLLSKYRIVELPKTKYCLTLDDLSFILKLTFYYPFNYFFILKNALKIANYSYLIKKYNCIAIIQTNEYSFTSSILTLYCNLHNIKHIDVMHGEKMFYIRDSFFAFAECYIWDEHYKKLFIKLGADPNQFIIEHPPVLDRIKDLRNYKGNKFKYYLEGIETTVQINNIKAIVERKFGNLTFRPHPLFSNIADLKNINITIEDPKLIKIVDSLKECEYVCAKSSTVLFQAFLMNKKIIVDDISNPKLFNELKNRDFIIFSKPHQMLSEILI